MAAEQRGERFEHRVEFVDYESHKGKCIMFLQNFQDPNSMDNTAKYVDMLQDIANRERRTLDIELDDLAEFYDDNGDVENPAFLDAVQTNTLRYQDLFAQAADEVMPDPTSVHIVEDVFDVICNQKQRLHEQNLNAAGAAGQQKDASNRVPPSILRRYDVYIHPKAKAERIKLRAVSSHHIGHLVRVRGVVTHVTDVKPLVSVVTYTDETSGEEIYQEVVGRTFTPLDGYRPNRPKSEVPPTMQTRGSKFIKYQEARIQEMADEVPEGSTPRSMALHFRGEVTRTAKAGDEVVISGIFLPEPFTGFRAMRAGLLTATFLEVMEVRQVKTSYTDYTITDQQRQEIRALAEDGDVYSRLSSSIAPEIFGHEDVKKVLLLQMVGGVGKSTGGMKLRGDVHVCLMGDPGVAKSQLLKHISRLAPRAVYTTGKGSSGVGLTAAVLRNPQTREVVLEGGALVLADKGICCIDEFDKMDEGDRTAIHEVMEQQTVSIAKAGITTTLNTRTTVLAAANPAWGRWDERRSAADNINMPAALLSRFDILWLILDRADEEMDRELAEHILSVHATGNAPARADGGAGVPQELLRAYIAEARRHSPTIPQHLTDYIGAIYVEMRADEESALGGSGATYTTPRTLMSVLRLSQAVAKLRFDDEVQQVDVDEAVRLMRLSKASVAPNAARRTREDPVSLAYKAICDWATNNRSEVVSWARLQDIMARLQLTRDAMLECVQAYENINVWQVVYDGENPTVRFFPGDIV